MRSHSKQFPSDRRGSVIVIVMVTLLFATFALLAFMEKASVDLLVEQREVVTRRLRAEAYSALEMTLGVLNQFREAGNGGLHGPSEGWSDPLGFAGYTPAEGRSVQIAFEDESGKISLPKANALALTNLFKNWELPQTEAEALADALLGWMKRDHVYTSAVQPNYESGAIPYLAPGRSMRSYHELAAIEKVRETFYDRDGRPNDLWRRFVDSVSLFDFARPNINAAKPDTLAALGQYNSTQQKNIHDRVHGRGAWEREGPTVLKSPAEAQLVAGATGDSGAFVATISALRIIVTVRDGQNEYRLATVIAPPNGARTIQTTATETRKETSGAAAKAASKQQQTRANAAQANARAAANNSKSKQKAAERNLRYPFTLLEIRENDEIPPPPPPLPNTLF
jgi:hypothetical protein